MVDPSRPQVVLTRQADDNRPLAEALRALGIGVVEVPCVALEAVRPGKIPPGPFQAVVFLSRRAASFFLDPGPGKEILSSSPRPLLAAVGTATARTVAEMGYHVDIVSDGTRAEDLEGPLLARLRPPAAVLLPCGDLHREDLDDRLRSAGLRVEKLLVYRNRQPEIPTLTPFSALVFVASPSAGQRLLQANPWLRKERFFVIGETTARALRQLGVDRVEQMGENHDGWLQRLALAAGVKYQCVGGPVSRYTINRSQELYNRACRAMPGGVSSPVRAFRSVGGTPIFFARASGAYFWDEDGNRYLDFCASWGPLILGHAPQEVVEAVRQAAAEGLSFGACSRREVELAELILEAFPDFQRVRFVSSGTEAVMTAVRLARAISGRDLLLKFDGGYHGHADPLLVKAGSGLATFGISSSAGVTPATAAQTLVCPFDDEQTLEEIFARHGARLAAALVEPLPANHGLLEQRPAWLKRLRQLCTRYGALLICDEVISGFRLAFGGYAARLGIAADLVTLGKIIGGGMPVGALVGPAQIMDQLAPLGPVYQAGTLSGNPVAMAAGRATLERLRDGAAYRKLDELGRVLETGLKEAARRIPWLNWRRCGSIWWLYLQEGELPRRADRLLPKAAERYRAIYPALLQRGYYLAPSAYEVAFLSTVQQPEEIAGFVASLAEVACEVP
jgi:glutamate-1-semialdehyde 2,1-aminomutase